MRKKVYESGSLIFALIFLLCFEAPQLEAYDCVFGFSTGHVGTTALGHPSNYRNSSHVQFFFEGKPFGQGSPVREMYMTNEEYNNIEREVGPEQERLFVENKYAPFLNEVMSRSTVVNNRRSVIFDMGHANLFFYRGIAQYFLQSKKPHPFCEKLRFVRIRRDRFESAISLTSANPFHIRESLCNNREVKFGFCPFFNEKSVLLKPLSRQLWDELTIFQQMLWLIDETEARWKAFVSEYELQGIHFSEFGWSIGHLEYQSSIESILPYIASLIDTQPATESVKRLHLHSNATTSVLNNPKILMNSIQQNAAYRLAMGLDK